jgi:hypothetical protein
MTVPFQPQLLGSLLPTVALIVLFVTGCVRQGISSAALSLLKCRQ